MRMSESDPCRDGRGGVEGDFEHGHIVLVLVVARLGGAGEVELRHRSLGCDLQAYLATSNSGRVQRVVAWRQPPAQAGPLELPPDPVGDCQMPFTQRDSAVVLRAVPVAVSR